MENHIGDTTEKVERCPWCQNHKGKTDLDFGVIDDACGQFVKQSMIKFCPFCGRKLRSDNATESH